MSISPIGGKGALSAALEEATRARRARQQPVQKVEPTAASGPPSSSTAGLGAKASLPEGGGFVDSNSPLGGVSDGSAGPKVA